MSEFKSQFKSNLHFIPAFILKILRKVVLSYYPNYQPIFINGKIQPGGDRNCLDRWELIKKEIIVSGSKTVLDLGSAEGFYVLQSAKELGAVSLGVDADVRRMLIAQIQVTEENIKPAGFLLGEITPEFLEKLPVFDTVILMSVLHHMMYLKGEDYCRKILRALKPKVGKAMIFEMGQSNETKNKWARSLPDMGESPHEWIKNFLLSVGFSKVTKIGESDSYQGNIKRALFLINP